MKDELKDLSVLIVGYRRADNILKILEICKDSGISNIYISVDGPKSGNFEGIEDHNKIQNNLAKFKSTFSGNVTIYLRERNVGCAASVMSSCDWFFEQTNYGAVLEDDCLPTKDFFIFAKNMEARIFGDKEIWLACGTQFAPKVLTNNSAIISQYALTWGWATSKLKWLEIKRSIFENNQIEVNRIPKLGIVDKVYWEAGARRAYQGFTDVWDTVLVYRMQIENKYAVLPSDNLITNVGNDFAATHTHGDSVFLNQKIGIFLDNGNIAYSPTVDLWLKENLYGISNKHLFSTKMRSILDLIIPQRPIAFGLLQRWNQATIAIS